MSDNEETTTAEETPEVDDATFDPARARAALEKKNREAQSLRQRLKELEPLARKARELEEAQKTEAQKAAEARAAAERERDEARIELLRYKVALAKGLPADLAARLRGGTEEELSKDADELLKLVGSKPASSARPVPDLKSAALPAGEQQIMSGKDVDAWIRRQAGVA